ncbi:MAG: F0F1 ATP synthase subunit epsilon [Eubacteriales bacterium]|jgi:F-type H+-transporting ATPase subunit epsilon|nr:F0F1 ATP synthase subunit epsilon [Bacillota bacterium]MBV1726767.1 F0F1 ATP synthase subunit epsilon [Desulforudis sp.]MDP3050064.1 F0F1 ATP synthase subunit epsilon [Eubacteriales bacterium]MBU4533190.1 F0F1 ATP synthase subunit epsilon [Bacillota bacterium]MBU4554776.1 F0F1 ATP synthase subunit epsilon [Bacillota bacterium]
MSKRLQHVLVVTPERVVYDEEARFVLVPGSEGDLGILPGHTPLITTLRIGLVRIRKDVAESGFVISGGLLEIRNNQVTVLTGAAETPEDIDLARAREARKRAETRLAAQGPSYDSDRARAALMRAITRLRVVGK